VELCGSGYVIDYCVSAFHKSREEEAFKNYVADGLYALVNQNSSYACRFEELLHPLSEEEKKKLKEDNKKQAKKIQSDLRKKLRG